MQPYNELTGNAERQIMELRQRARGDPRRRSIYYNWANDVLARWMKSASPYANTQDDLRNLQDLVNRLPRVHLTARLVGEHALTHRATGMHQV